MLMIILLILIVNYVTLNKLNLISELSISNAWIDEGMKFIKTILYQFPTHSLT